MVAHEPDRLWEFVTAPPRIAPGVTSMVGYRARETPSELHRGMPSSTLTFIVSLDEGVEAAESAEALCTARPTPLLLGGLQVQPAHVRQCRGQAGVQLAVHPLAARTLFGMPSAADRVGVTSRHLTTLFQQEVGRSPKTVAMLMRFQHATTRISDSVRRCATIDLDAVAAATGYSDQAHLTREFTRFAGAPPRRWIAEEFRNIQDGGHSSGAHCGHDWC